MDEQTTIETGAGNVFVDLGLRDSGELLARAELMRHVTSIIRHRHLTQTEAAEVLGTKQPVISDLMNGKLAKFSLDRLVSYLHALDRDVQIVIKRPPNSSRRPARTLVTAD